MYSKETMLPPYDQASSPSHVSKRRSVGEASLYAASSPRPAAVSGYDANDSSGYTLSYAGGYYAGGTPPQNQPPSATHLATTTSPRYNIATSWTPTASVIKSVPPPQRPVGYDHNVVTSCLWLPCWCLIFLGQGSNVPLQTFMALSVVVYGLDLAMLREAVLYTVWLSAIVQSLVTMWYGLLAENSDDDAVLTILFGTAVQALFFTATACWVMLQCDWLVKDGNTFGSMAQQLEAALHAVLPPVFAALVTASSTKWILVEAGSDVAATAAPHIFAVALVVAMVSAGAVESSFSAQNHAPSNGHGADPLPPIAIGSGGNHDIPAASYAIHKRVAWGHSALLLLTPGAMHLTSFLVRILSRNAGTDDLYDFLVAITFPYLLHALVQTFFNYRMRQSPYFVPTRRPPDVAQLIAPFGAIILFSFAAQQRYLIPMCHRFSYHFMGVQSSTLLLTLYWTMTTVAASAALLIWGRISPATGLPIFGEYHEDIVQLVLAVSGLCLGKAFALPWNMTPLPILGILGLCLWASTRMLRYLGIFLFVLHATGVVVFTYRFVGIDQSLSLPLPGVELSLIRFGTVVTMSSILIGLVTGLSVRSSGGWMAPWLRKFDIAGLALVVYTVILMVLEITLLKRPTPTKELAGVEAEEEDLGEALYDPARALLTSAILIGIVLFMRHVRILRDRSSSVVISFAMGKAIAVFIDAAESESGTASTDTRGTAVLYRSFIATVLFAVVFAPRVFLEPVHIKGSVRNRRSLKGGPDLPNRAVRTVGLYAVLFLPVTLVATIPDVLFPFVNAAAGKFTIASYYGVSTPISELLGSAIALWGLALLSMLNHYLPDGGGEAWKKLSALAFLMGVGIFFTAPTMGMSIGTAAYNPYASMSSLGSQLILRSKSRTGGWGILSAGLAMLLALSGPLELKERRHASGRKDKHLLFRTMLFSLLFGGGVSWFITLQSMSESDWLFLILTLVASMSLAFLGTVAAVLGYFMEPDNFDEVEQIARGWLFGLVAFLPIAGIPQLLRLGSSHPFGAGGWLSTYLSVGCLTALSFALSLRFRQGKDQRTRSLGNLATVCAWLSALVVLYGRFGVAGLDSNFALSTLAGVPSSVIGTVALAPILLALEGETTSRSRGARAVISHKVTPSFAWLALPQLTRINRWFPLFAGTVGVFLCASLYSILLRGSGIFSFYGVSAAWTHEDIFASEVGSLAVSGQASNLSALAEFAISRNAALTTSARLAGSGFWTAASVFAPLMHLAGVAAMLPSLSLLFSQFWLGATVASSQVTFCLPLNAIPVLLCRGIPSLRAAAILIVSGAVMQLLLRRQSEQAFKMQI